MFFPTPDYLTLPCSPEAWIVEDLIPTSGKTLLYGPAKRGKSFLGLQLAAAIGDPDIPDFMGFPVKVHGPVAYLQVDTPRGLWTKRLRDSFLPNGYTLRDLHWADTQVEGFPFPFNIVTGGHQWLKTAVAALQPVLVIVDTVREIHSGDENDSGHMKNVLSLLFEAVRPSALLLIAHSRKPKAEITEEDITAENRGSNYVVGAVDVIVQLTGSREKPRLRFESRASEDSMRLARDPLSGLFRLEDPLHFAIQRTIRRHPGVSPSKLAQELFALYPDAKSPDAIRKMIERLRGEEVH